VWTCEEAVTVVGNPGLLREHMAHNIQRGDALSEAAKFYGVTEKKILEV